MTSITKERTARVIPNAIQIQTRDEKYFFTSFSARDKTFIMVFRIWQFALLNQVGAVYSIYSYHIIEYTYTYALVVHQNL